MKNTLERLAQEILERLKGVSLAAPDTAYPSFCEGPHGWNLSLLAMGGQPEYPGICQANRGTTRVSQLYCDGCPYGYRRPGHLLIQCDRGEEPCPSQEDIDDYRDHWLGE